MTYLWLHLASRFLALLAVWVGFWISLRVYRWYRIGTKRHLDYSKQIAEASDVKPILSRTHTIIVNHWPVILVAMSSFLLGAYVGDLNSEFHRQNFVDMHDVHVLGKSDDFVFQMDVEDPDTHQRTPFMIRFCPDYQPTHEMQPGTVLTRLKYERRDFDNCASVGKNSLGYIFRRDKNGNPLHFDSR